MLLLQHLTRSGYLKISSRDGYGHESGGLRLGLVDPLMHRATLHNMVLGPDQ